MSRMQERGGSCRVGRGGGWVLACLLAGLRVAFADACLAPGLTTLSSNPNDECVLGDSGATDAVRINVFAPGNEANGIVRVVNNAAQVTIGPNGNVQNGVTGAPVINVTAGTLANGIVLERDGANRANISSAGDGIRVSGAGTVVLGGIVNAGQIGASVVGVHVVSGSVNGGLLNSGRIEGTPRSVWVEAGASLDYIDIGGSSAEFVGEVLASGADLRILSGASYRNQSALGSVFNVRSLEVQPGASFTLDAAFTVATGITNAGTFTLPGSASRSLSVPGTFQNDGTLALPAGAVLTVNGDYQHTGTLRTGVADNSSFGRLVVSGTATLPANAAVEVDVTGGGLASGLLDDVLSAGVLVSDGTFAVTDNSLLFDFAAVVDGNTVDIQVMDAPPSGGGTPGTGGLSLETLVRDAGSRPALGAAAVLDRLLRDPEQGDAEALAPVVDVFARLPTEAALVAAVNETLPLLTSASPLVALGALAGANGVVAARQAGYAAAFAGREPVASGVTGLAGGDAVTADRALWLRPFTSFIDQRPRTGAPGFEAEARGLIVGGDVAAGPAWRIGAALAWHDADIDSAGPTTGAAQRAALTGWQFFATAARTVGTRTLFSTQFDVARLRTEGSRQLPTFGLGATSDFHTTAVHGGVALRQRWRLAEDLDWLPALSADWTHLDAEGYRESGAGALGLVVDGDVQEAAVFAIESAVAARLAKGLDVTARLGVGWDILAEQAVTTAAYAGGGASFTTPGVKPAPVIARGGVGLVTALGEESELALDYAADVRQDFTQQSAALTLRWAFQL